MCESDFITLHNTLVSLIGTLERFQKNSYLGLDTHKKYNRQGFEIFFPISKLQY